MDSKQRYDSDNDLLLDKLLKEEPGYFLPDDFADKLAKKIEIRLSVRQNVIEFLTILGVILAIFITFGGIYYFLNKEDFLNLTSFLNNGYTGVAAVIVLFIFFMDKVMLRLLNQLR